MTTSERAVSSSPVVIELERELGEKELTVALLTRQFDELSALSAPALSEFESSEMLEQVLARRTQELEAQHHELDSVLTQLRHAQSQLLQSQKLEAIGSMAAGIAHEINTPAQFASDNTSFLRKSFVKLTALLEAYQLLLDDLEAGPLDGERIAQERARMRRSKLDFLLQEIPNALDGALEGLSRISSIVRAMKEFSHPSNGIPQPVDLREIITTTVTVSRNEWKYVAEVSTDFDSNLAPVPCLRDELSQVILNLIVNSAHAIQSRIDNSSTLKGKIHIATKSYDNYAEIAVTDNGCGIPEAIHHRVFEPFFTTKPVGSGTGQGLAIAYSVVVDKHKGRIHFTSSETDGTTFVLRLPLSENVAVPASLPVRSSP